MSSVAEALQPWLCCRKVYGSIIREVKGGRDMRIIERNTFSES